MYNPIVVVMRIIVIAKPSEVDKKLVREALEENCVSPKHVIIRRDSDHIEVDIEVDAEPRQVAEAFKRLGLEIITISIPEEAEPIDPYSEALKLMREGRFWEAHERLEGLWRETGDKFIRGLILFTIPYIKQQMGQYDRVWQAIERFVRFAEETGDPRLECLSKKIMEAYKEGWLERIDLSLCLS